jgi:DNA-binding GntR family transcriptional regulator
MASLDVSPAVLAAGGNIRPMPSSRGDTVGTIVAALTELILTGQFSAGDRVTESEMAALLGVSRTPVREAIAQLVTRGLLVKENNRSARVHRPSLDDLVEIYEMRTVLECYAARKAAVEASSDHIKELRSLAAQLLIGDGTDKWFHDHARFHHTIVAAANRPRASAVVEDLQHQSEPYVRLVTKLEVGQRGQACQDHLAIVKAIARGDSDGAEELTRAHLASTVGRVTRILEAAGQFLLPGDGRSDRLMFWAAGAG